MADWIPAIAATFGLLCMSPVLVEEGRAWRASVKRRAAERTRQAGTTQPRGT